MSFVYCVFGLHLNSNIAIPGLVAIPSKATIDVRVWLDLMPPWINQGESIPSRLWYVSPYQNEQGKPNATIQQLMDGAYFQLTYYDGIEFIIDRAGTEIWAIWPGELTLEDTSIYLLGHVLGLVLRLRGVICLHASAVAVKDRAIAFVGASGTGKSTTAAAFAKRGLAVLSDDNVGLLDRGNTFLVQPAYPRLRLWATSVNTLYGSPDALPRLTQKWDKRYLDLTESGYQFQEQPLPLAAVYILGERSNHPAAPWVEAMPAYAALMFLVKNTYMNYLLDKAMRAREFDLLSRVVANVSLRRVTINTNIAYVSRLCDVILEDFQDIPNL